MSVRRHLGFVAAAATLLAAAPLAEIFDRWTWLVQSFIAVALVTAAGTAARALRGPVWAQAAAMGGALLLALTWLFPSGDELLGLLPSPGTFAHFGALMTGSVEDMRGYAVPVPDTDPLLFVTVLGVGAVAVVVDLLAVGLRRPALAGLPMLAIYSVPVAVLVDSVSPVPFVIGAAGFLWLLVADNVDRVRHFGRRFTGDGRDVDVWEPSPLAAAGRRLAVLGVVVAVLLPVAMPDMTSGLLTRLNGVGGEGDGRGGVGGGPGRVNLFAALSGELTRGEVRDLVRVTTSETEPHYLRLAVADDLRPDGFAARNPSGRPVTRDLPDPRDGDAGRVRYTGQQATVEITDDFRMPFLPVYSTPVEMRDVDASWLFDQNMGVVFSNRSQSQGRTYSFDYLRPEFSPQALDDAPSLPAQHPIRRMFTAVPGPVREVEELVEELTDGERTDYAKVMAIYRHFSRENGYRYSLSTEGGTSGRDIVDFLANKVGFCQQYAAAMAWLVRTADIPARVAFGFTNGSKRQDNTYTLTNLNLHAWTEVYFEGAGWVPFDATPAASVAGSTRSAWAPDTDAPDPLSPSAAPTAAPGTDPSAGPAGPDEADRGLDEGFTGAAGPTEPGPPRWPWWTAAAIVLLLALLAVPALRRALLRRRRQGRIAVAGALARSAAGSTPGTPDAPGTPGSPGAPGEAEPAPGVARVVVGADPDRMRADAHAAWDELIDTLVDFRLRVDPAETPRATADRLIGAGLTGDGSAPAVRLLGVAEERARYARDPLVAGNLAEALRTVRRSIAAGAGRRTKLVAAVLPPSVLLRWRLATMDGFARSVALGGALRDRLLRWSPRRLLAPRPR
nr:transglutaminaseTgpA domain-containing protein [Micromonospora sp. DSM 115978]